MASGDLIIKIKENNYKIVYIKRIIINKQRSFIRFKVYAQ